MLYAAIFLGPARGLDRIAGAGAVDEDAFLAVRFARLGQGGIDAGVVGNVAFAEHAAEFGGDRLALFFLQIEDPGLAALGGEPPAGRGAGAPGPPMAPAGARGN